MAKQKATKKASKKVTKKRSSRKKPGGPEKWTFGPLDLECGSAFKRADLEFYGIDHFRPSFTVQVFFNDAKVEPDSASDKRSSYAGTFSVFAHGNCGGDVGHCDASRPQGRFSDPASHPLTRAFKRLVVTEPLRRVCKTGKPLMVTVIVTPAATRTKQLEYDKLLDLQGMQVTTFE